MTGLLTDAELIERLELPIGFGGSGGGGAAVVEEEVEEVEVQTAFDVELTTVDKKSKIKVIKDLKNILGLGLKDVIRISLLHLGEKYG